MPQPGGLLERLAADLAVPHRNTSIEDAGEVLARSAANLALITSAEDMEVEAEAEEVSLQSVADLRVAAACPDGAINNAIECLTEQLAAFCFEHLEGGVNASASNSSEEIDLNTESDLFDNGLTVREKH